MAIKHPKKQKLRAFLKKMRAEGKKLDLVNFTYFCRLITHALAEDKRWKQYTLMCKERGFSKTGQALPENILEHTGIDTPLLGGMMLAREMQAATPLSYCLLPVAFALHDMPEGVALQGDVDYGRKTSNDDKEEDSAFALLMSVFPPQAAEYFSGAYSIVQEAGTAKRAGVPMGSISLDAQFFIAVEVVGYLSRAIYEVKVGNIVFANTFWGHLTAVRYSRKIFVSFEELVGPHIPFMEECTEKYFDCDWNNWRSKVKNLSFG